MPLAIVVTLAAIVSIDDAMRSNRASSRGDRTTHHSASRPRAARALGGRRRGRGFERHRRPGAELLRRRGVREETQLDAAGGGEDADLSVLTLRHQFDGAAIRLGEFISVPVVDVGDAGARGRLAVAEAAADFLSSQPALAGVVQDRNGGAEELGADEVLSHDGLLRLR